MKTNIIYNDDCIKILNSKIDEKSIDLIFADPPYNLSGNGTKSSHHFHHQGNCFQSLILNLL
jgi:DNA modification methylase